MVFRDCSRKVEQLIFQNKRTSVFIVLIEMDMLVMIKNKESRRFVIT